MSTDRRSFIKTVTAVGGAVGLGALPRVAGAAPPNICSFSSAAR